MFIQYLRLTCLFFVLFTLNSTSFADVYKWIDDEGITHYSQQAPRDHQAKIIKAPPPPARDPNEAQKELDTLIEKQSGTFEEKEQQRRLAREAANDKAERDQYCRVKKHNLEQFQNNPGRRMVDADGVVTEPNEEQRQKKIIQIKQQLADKCP